MNAALCVMVVFIHLFSEGVVSLPRLSAQWWICYAPQTIISMAVYGFIFLSGLKLFLRPPEGALGTYYKKRFSAIVLPYLAAVTVYYAIFHIKFGYAITLSNVLRFYLLGLISSHTYFIVAILQFYLLMPLWRRLVNRTDPTLLFVFSCFGTLLFRPVFEALANAFPTFGGAPSFFVIALPYTDRIFLSYLAVWMMGCLAGKYYDRFRAFVTERRTRLYGLFAVCAMLSLGLRAVSEYRHVSIPCFSVVDLAYFVSSILALSALALQLSTPKTSISAKSNSTESASFPDAPEESALVRNPIVRWIDRNSFRIYLYHMIVLLFAQYLANRLGILAISARFLFTFALIALLTPMICEAINFLRHLLFKKA